MKKTRLTKGLNNLPQTSEVKATGQVQGILARESMLSDTLPNCKCVKQLFYAPLHNAQWKVRSD